MCRTGSPLDAHQWLAKDYLELGKTLGAPKEVVPLTDSRGERIFGSRGEPHFGLESNAWGLVKICVANQEGQRSAEDACARKSDSSDDYLGQQLYQHREGS